MVIFNGDIMNFVRRMGFILVLLFIAVNAAYSQLQTDLVSVHLNRSSIEAAAGSRINIDLTVYIKDGYHINSNKPKDKFLIPVTITSQNKQFPLTKVDYPEPEMLSFSSSPELVSVYIGTVKIGVTINVSRNVKPGKYKVPINFNYQSCDDENCFPPATVVNDLEVTVTKTGKEKKDSTPEAIPKKDIKSKKEEIANKDTEKEKTASSDSVSLNDTSFSAVTIPQNTAGNSAGENTSLFIAIVFAFAGGIILNLMPCVLPVLSIKIMGFIQQAGEDKRKTRKHGLAFTLGVLVSFWILAGLLIALRAGGEYLGWGFQLQSPAFIIVLSILLFLFGLSLFGVFEIGTTFTSAGQNLNSTGYMGSFASGILATIVATPCTAPFMGSALGFALSQPVYVSVLVFTSLGLGMALPYVLLTNIPKLQRFVPKPGAWMESFKQFMGFLLMATVLWLLWILSLQAGSESVIFLLISMVIASLGAWIFGRWGNIAKETKVRRTAQLISLIIIAAALLFSFKNIEAKSSKNTTITRQGKIEWHKYSPEKVEEGVKKGDPVFVDFTAAWCLSCQVNEKVAFGSDKVQDAFADKNILALRGDWTNSDSEITKALAQFGRNSVPLYVLYKPGEKPVILPEILTPQIVLDAIRKI
jgi:thiol:disulfide interchange protein